MKDSIFKSKTLPSSSKDIEIWWEKSMKKFIRKYLKAIKEPH